MAQTRPIIGVHIDLKGVMFKPKYIPQLLRDLAGQGISAVLVEYEDIFPFEGWDFAADNSVVWSTKTVRKFLGEAAKNRIEVIPLQQCLGHLEYVYRWDRYARFAEDRRYPSTVCLSNTKAKAQVIDMLGQVIAAHPESRYVHLGMDEARGLDQAAKRLGHDHVLDLFLPWLGELVDFVDARGKKAMIWTDMLEDHFRPGAFDRFKDRVVFVPWDYGTTGRTTPMTRIGGWRTSKAWLAEADDPAAAPLGPATQFVEDLPRATRNLLTPYQRGREFLALHQADLWSSLGFTVVGATVVRSSAHLSVMPDYNHLHANIDAWGRAIKRTRGAGLIGTSWARGTTFGPPGYSIDLTWPSIAHLARAMGATPKNFWPGIAPKTVQRIIAQLGRCKTDWVIEGRVAEDMEKLAPKVKAHRYEWDSLAMMARVYELRRRAEFAQLEVDHFHANIRPPVAEWRRRLREQAQILKEITALRKKVDAHFSKRYHGEAYAEWLRDLFDLHQRRLKQCQSICRRKLAMAKSAYATRAST